MIYLLIFGAVLLTNLLPAFAPPTWALLVFFRLHYSINSWSLLALGVCGAVLGRYFLARGFSLIGPRLSKKTQGNLRSAATLLETKRSASFITLALFALSPISTAQLFEAAGLARTKLKPLLLAFALGRSISYAGYVFGAGALKSISIGKTLLAGITSPWALFIQFVLLLGFIPLTKINWHRFLGNHETTKNP